MKFILLTLLLAVSCGQEPSRSPAVEPFDIARDAVAPHVVPMRVLSLNNEIYGTGFYIKYLNRTFILTNAHVCAISYELKIFPKIQFGNMIEDVIAIDTEHDLCLVSSSRASGLELSLSSLDPMEKIFLVGYPRGLEKTIREGRLISSMFEVIPWVKNTPIRIQQISATAYPGNSGSPITNTSGEVVGVLFAGDESYPHEPYVVPLEAIHKFLMRFSLNK